MPLEDNSLTELLPVKSDVCSFNSLQMHHGQDKTERQLSTSTRVIKGWPQTSKTLRRMDWKHRALLAIDIIIALIPLSFIGKSQSTAEAVLEAFKQSLADAGRNSAGYSGGAIIRLADINCWRKYQDCYYHSMLKPVHEVHHLTVPRAPLYSQFSSLPLSEGH